MNKLVDFATFFCFGEVICKVEEYLSEINFSGDVIMDSLTSLECVTKYMVNEKENIFRTSHIFSNNYYGILSSRNDTLILNNNLVYDDYL